MTLDAPVSVGSEESPVIRWLMTDGRRITDPNFAMCLIEAGVDVSRITTGVPVLHPQLYSYSGLWELWRELGVGDERRDRIEGGAFGNAERLGIWGSAWRTRSRLLGQNHCGRFWWYGSL